MITLKGVGFLIVALLVYLLARLTQVGWLYLVDAVLWGIIMLSAVLPWLGATFLAAQRRLVLGGGEGLAGPSEGESVRVALALRNRTFWPRFFLNAHYDCSLAPPDRRRLRFFLGKLPSANSFPMESEFTVYQRGEQQLGPVYVESSAPFTLFRRRVCLAPAQPVLVYPRIYLLRRLALVDGLDGALTRPQKSRVGLEIIGSRPYFPGDPRRHIHWRNTARVGRPMVKEFEDPRDRALNLIFDATQNWGEGRETTLEYSIKIVASVADYARRHRISVRIWGGSLSGATVDPVEQGSQPWSQVLQQLARARPGDGANLAASLGHLPPGSSVLAMVASADQSGVEAVTRLAPGLERLAVVALDGFGAMASGADALQRMEQARIPLTRCRSGELWETLQGLAQLGEPVRARAEAGTAY